MLIPSPHAHAQRVSLQLANRAFENFAYADAIGLYEAAWEKNPADLFITRRLAECNRHLGRTAEVEHWYKLLIDRNESTDEELYQYTQALKSNGKYTEAAYWLGKYARQNPNDSRVAVQVSLLEYVHFLLRDSMRYEVTKSTLSTPGRELTGAFYRENKFIFSSTQEGVGAVKRTYAWDNLPFLDLYEVSLLKHGRHTPPKLFSKNLKSKFHDGPLAIHPSGMEMLITRNNLQGNRLVRGNDKLGSIQLFSAKRMGDDWILGSPLPFCEPNHAFGHAAWSPDGNTVYFVSDRPGGFGSTDIWSVSREEGKWGRPINLGERINTPGNEMFPFINNDGILYFASNGLGGLGGLDIFMATPERGVFNRVENLGYPANSPKDDFGLVLDKNGTNGFFTSAREGGMGYDDIYAIHIKEVPVIIKGMVIDRRTNDLLADVNLTLKNEKDSLIGTYTSLRDGRFQFEVAKGNTYTLSAETEDYLKTQIPVSTKEAIANAEVFAQLFMEPTFDLKEMNETPLIVEDDIEIIKLEYINYDYGKATIRRDAAEALDRLAAIMLEYPDLEIQLESHTDSRGSDAFNMKLSQRRAFAANEYLLQKGIDPDRIKYAGYGETRLLNKCDDGMPCTDAEHAVNRRTIVKVVKKAVYRSRRGKRSIFYF